jgi:hypothetical protein
MGTTGTTGSCRGSTGYHRVPCGNTGTTGYYAVPQGAAGYYVVLRGRSGPYLAKLPRSVRQSAGAVNGDRAAPPRRRERAPRLIRVGRPRGDTRAASARMAARGLRAVWSARGHAADGYLTPIASTGMPRRRLPRANARSVIVRLRRRIVLRRAAPRSNARLTRPPLARASVWHPSALPHARAHACRRTKPTQAHARKGLTQPCTAS